MSTHYIKNLWSGKCKLTYTKSRHLLVVPKGEAPWEEAWHWKLRCNWKFYEFKHGVVIWTQQRWWLAWENCTSIKIRAFPWKFKLRHDTDYFLSLLALLLIDWMEKIWEDNWNQMHETHPSALYLKNHFIKISELSCILGAFWYS